MRSLGVAATLALFASAWVAGCSGRAPSPAVDARSVFELAGVGDSAEELAHVLRERARHHTGSLGPAAVSTIRHGVVEIAEPERVRAIAAADFARRFEAARGSRAAAWYRGATGARIVSMERRAASADWDAQMPGFVDSMDHAQPPVSRVDLLEQLVTATGAAQSAVEMQLGVTRVLAHGALELEGEATPEGVAALEARLLEIRSQLFTQLRMQLPIVSLFVYREASESELAEYLRFAETPDGQWLFEASRQSMRALVMQLERDLVDRMAASRRAGRPSQR